MAVVYSKTAEKQLMRLTRKTAALIIAKIEQYAANRSGLANQIKKLKGSHFLRLRVGNYRVIFTEDGAVMSIIEIGDRRDIYD